MTGVTLQDDWSDFTHWEGGAYNFLEGAPVGALREERVDHQDRVVHVHQVDLDQARLIQGRVVLSAGGGDSMNHQLQADIADI